MKDAPHSEPQPKPKHQPTLQTHLAGVRAVAFMEAVKGAFVLLLCLGLFGLLHKDVGEWAENIVYNLHLDPDHWLARIFLKNASGMTDKTLVLFGIVAFLYACVRFTEAYGLWYRRTWAEWFAVISGSLYLPYEIYEIVRRTTIMRWCVFLGNVAIIIYLLYIRSKSEEERKTQAVKAQQEEAVVNR